MFVSLVRKYQIELLDWLPENLTVEALRRDNEEREPQRREAKAAALEFYKQFAVSNRNDTSDNCDQSTHREDVTKSQGEQNERE